jgi:hypothetical protein
VVDAVNPSSPGEPSMWKRYRSADSVAARELIEMKLLELDARKLLAEAECAGLSIKPEGERLHIRGPREAEVLGRIVLRRKADLLPLLINVLAPTAWEAKAAAVVGQDVLARHTNAAATPEATQSKPRLIAAEQPLAGRKNVEETFNPELVALIDWFHQANAAGMLPIKPFAVAPHIQITDPGLHYKSLEIDIGAGPMGPRGRLGGLRTSAARQLIRLDGHKE